MTSYISQQKVLELYPLLPPSISKYITSSSSIVQLSGHLNTVLSIDDTYILRAKRIKIYDFDDVGGCSNFKAAVDHVAKNNFTLHPSHLVLEEITSKSGEVIEYLLYKKEDGIALETFIQTRTDGEIENVVRRIADIMNQLHQITAPNYGYFKGQKFSSWNEFIQYWINKQSVYIQKNKTLTDGEITQVKSIFKKYYQLFSISKPSTIHLDLNCTNILIDSLGNITSIIDWDNARGGDPVADISYTVERVYNIGSLKKFSSLFLDEYMKIAKIEKKETFMLKYHLYSLFYAFKLLPVHSTHTTQNENVKNLVQHVRKMLTQFAITE